MLRSVLVALDGSIHSEAAIELSIRWAKQFDAKLCGLGIVDQPMHAATAAASTEEGAAQMQGHWKNAAERVDGYVQQFSQACQTSAVAATALTAVGVPFEQIVLEAQQHDLIVMTHEFETPESPADTFTQVLESSPRPIVTVPQAISKADPIVIAYDGSLQSSRALQMFIAIGLHRAGRIYVVSVDPNYEKAVRLSSRALEFLALHDVDAEARPLASADPPADTILAQIAELQAGLIVMGAHKRTILKEFFLGSVNKTILSESTLPLFLYQ